MWLTEIRYAPLLVCDNVRKTGVKRNYIYFYVTFKSNINVDQSKSLKVGLKFKKIIWNFMMWPWKRCSNVVYSDTPAS